MDKLTEDSNILYGLCKEFGYDKMNANISTLVLLNRKVYIGWGPQGMNDAFAFADIALSQTDVKLSVDYDHWGTEGQYWFVTLK